MPRQSAYAGTSERRLRLELKVLGHACFALTAPRHRGSPPNWRAVSFQTIREADVAARKKAAKKRAASKRELISPKGSKRYVRRDASGEFKKEVSVGRSLAADRRSKAKTIVKKGQGDRGDTSRTRTRGKTSSRHRSS
jgi:hypothetical protein